MHLPFLPLVNLLSEMDRERGKFLEMMGTNEGEKLSRNFFMSLGQRWAHTTSKSRVCLKPGHFVFTRTGIKPRSVLVPGNGQGHCPLTPNEGQGSTRPLASLALEPFLFFRCDV